MLRFESSSGTLFTFLFFFIFNSNPSSSPTPFTDLRRLVSHILSSFSILISDLYRILSYNIIQFYSQDSSPNHRFRGDELLSCLKGITPHSRTEAAGVVTAIGTGVCDLKIGDVVYHHFGSAMGTYTAGCFGLLADKAMFLPLINHLVVASVMGSSRIGTTRLCSSKIHIHDPTQPTPPKYFICPILKKNGLKLLQK
ncbi:putative GroES-like superfamily protein [Helianthus annuus]|nr:putative GroES-like superfamily protein [Helianthus annuus]